MKLYDVIRKEKENASELSRREQEGSAPKFNDFEPAQGPRFVLTRKRLVIILASIAFLVILYVAGLALVQAKITIVERRIPFSLSDARLELSNQEKADEGRLSFQAMVVTTSITREVYGSALTTSNTKATGSVVFFNEYSSAKQTVKKGAILTATNGKKYVTQAQVVVPGYTTVSKKKTAGTSPSVAIAALEVGESYNSEGTTFSVSGWTNASKTFYARSTDIVGGESGVSHTLTAKEQQDAVATFQVQLVERLKRETRGQIPDDFVTFPELQFPIIDTESFVFKGGKVRFPATMTGTMVSYLIPRALLEQAIASKAITERSYPQVAVPSLGDLTFDLRSAVPNDPKIIPDAITIGVSGSGTVITKVPIDKIKEALIGKPRRDFSDAIVGIAEVDTARFRLLPFWSPRFPSKWSKIDVLVK